MKPTKQANLFGYILNVRLVLRPVLASFLIRLLFQRSVHSQAGCHESSISSISSLQSLASKIFFGVFPLRFAYHTPAFASLTSVRSACLSAYLLQL